MTKYTPKVIAKELRATALNQAYYGNALHVAKDMPCIVNSPEHRHAILRYLVGKQKSTDHILLQEAADIVQASEEK